MQKQSKIFLLFCLCLMFLPNLVNAETYDAYFVESNEYNDIINQNDNKTTVGQVKRYAFNADLNWVKYKKGVSLKSSLGFTANINVNTVNATIDDYQLNETTFIKALHIEDSLNAYNTMNFYPNSRTTYNTNISVNTIIDFKNITEFQSYIFNGGSQYMIFSFSKNSLSDMNCRLGIGNNSAGRVYSSYFEWDVSEPFMFGYEYDYTNTIHKVYCKSIDGLEVQYFTTTLRRFTQTNLSFRNIYQRFSGTIHDMYVLAIDSNRLLVENTSLVGIYSNVLDSEYTENRILEMYDIKSKSYGLNDYGIESFYDNYYHYLNHNVHSNVLIEIDDSEIDLESKVDYTRDISFDSSIKRFREVGIYQFDEIAEVGFTFNVYAYDEDLLIDANNYTHKIIFSVDESTEIVSFWLLSNNGGLSFDITYSDGYIYITPFRYSDFVDVDGTILDSEENFIVEVGNLDYNDEVIILLNEIYFYALDKTSISFEIYVNAQKIDNDGAQYLHLSCEFQPYTFSGLASYIDSSLYISDISPYFWSQDIYTQSNVSIRLKEYTVFNTPSIPYLEIRNMVEFDIIAFYEGYEIISEFSGFNQFLNHNITDYLLYFMIINITVKSDEYIYDLIIDSYFAYSEFYNNSNYIVNYTVDEYTQDLTIFFLYIYLFCDNINFTTDITISTTEYWLIDWEIVEVGWFSVLMKGIAPLSIIVVFAIAGYHFFKIKGVICAIALSFIVLYFMNMINLVSVIMLVLVMITMLIYNIKRKGANIDV